MSISSVSGSTPTPTPAPSSDQTQASNTTTDAANKDAATTAAAANAGTAATAPTPAEAAHHKHHKHHRHHKHGHPSQNAALGNLLDPSNAGQGTSLLNSQEAAQLLATTPAQKPNG